MQVSTHARLRRPKGFAVVKQSLPECWFNWELKTTNIKNRVLDHNGGMFWYGITTGNGRKTLAFDICMAHIPCVFNSSTSNYWRYRRAASDNGLESSSYPQRWYLLTISNGHGIWLRIIVLQTILVWMFVRRVYYVPFITVGMSFLWGEIA